MPDPAVDFRSIEAAIAELAEERSRGDAFERVVAHYLRHDPVVGMRRVWTWRDWPGRLVAGVGPVDLGIDLVAQDERGQLVGVQVKHRLDPSSHLRWQEVSTALGFRPDLFSRRLVITNAADRTANARKATVTTPNTGWVLREDLLASPIDWTGALSAGTGTAAPVRVVREPRQYQMGAVAEVVESLADHERAQLIMACGSGKTLVTLWIADARGDARILVLVPTLLLLKQFRREWRQTTVLPFVDLAVCSDGDTVDDDELQVRADELGVPVTTDPAVIAAFLRGPGRRVVFGTYASSGRVAEAQTHAGVAPFDLVVADEAHRIAGVVNTAIHRERDLGVVLDADRIQARRRLFATATPRVYGRATRARFDDTEDVEVASMDDEALFGPVAHRLWFRAAVDLGVLTDYELVAVLVTDEEVASLVREREGVVVDGKVLDAETLATLVAIRRAIPELGLTRTITFHHTIARAKEFALALQRIALGGSPPDAMHISGAMSVDERERILDALGNPARPTVVTNARCLTEGIDVPSLDAVAFVDRRSSAVDIVQAVGRVMRRAPGKERGYVVVPVFLDRADLANPAKAVESSAFVGVLEVLRALRAHDPDLTADASRIKASLGRREAVAGGHIADHVRLIGTSIDVGRFERALELRFVEVSAAPFEVGMLALGSFVAREGHARVRRDDLEGDFRLGGWVSQRRSDFRGGRLDPARVAELEALPGWTWEPEADDWAAVMEALRAFTTREGHARVPQRHVESNRKLGIWVSGRRSEHRAGRLDPARVAELEALPGWTWEPEADDWAAGLAALRAFAAREGHARVPRGNSEPGMNLANWVTGRRADFKAGRLDPARIRTLTGLPGWSWDPGADDWAQWFVLLRTYVAREGDARVSPAHVEGGQRLGRWVVKRRADYRAGRLDTARVGELEAVPGWTWEPFRDDWATALAALRAFVVREGHARVPRDAVVGDVRLGTWVALRRVEHRAGRLEPGRVSELDSIPGWTWTPTADDSAAAIQALQAFAAREGHARVPQQHLEAGIKLGTWVNGRRQDYRRDRLDPNLAAALEALPGWTWEPRADDDAAAMDALRAFVAREAHARVPTHHIEGDVQLGAWVAGRRSLKRAARLEPARVAELEGLPGWAWQPHGDRWLASMAALRTFVAREGHARVPQRHIEAGIRLGGWVADRRQDHRRGRLGPDRRADLEALPGWTWNRLKGPQDRSYG